MNNSTTNSIPLYPKIVWRSKKKEHQSIINTMENHIYDTVYIDEEFDIIRVNRLKMREGIYNEVHTVDRDALHIILIVDNKNVFEAFYYSDVNTMPTDFRKNQFFGISEKDAKYLLGPKNHN